MNSWKNFYSDIQEIDFFGWWVWQNMFTFLAKRFCKFLCLQEGKNPNHLNRWKNSLKELYWGRHHNLCENFILVLIIFAIRKILFQFNFFLIHLQSRTISDHIYHFELDSYIDSYFLYSFLIPCFICLCDFLELYLRMPKYCLLMVILKIESYISAWFWWMLIMILIDYLIFLYMVCTSVDSTGMNSRVENLSYLLWFILSSSRGKHLLLLVKNIEGKLFYT